MSARKLLIVNTVYTQSTENVVLQSDVVAHGRNPCTWEARLSLKPDRPCLFYCLFIYFETGFLCETALVVLELAFVDQAGLELTELQLLLPTKCWD